MFAELLDSLSGWMAQLVAILKPPCPVEDSAPLNVAAALHRHVRILVTNL